MIHGADRLAATTKAASHTLAKLPMDTAGDIVLDRATATAPRRTGALATSHTTRQLPAGITITATARHATPVHQGWHNVPGRPWLRTAATTTQAQWTKATESEVQTILDTIQGA